jgi:hypothetical protein
MRDRVTWFAQKEQRPAELHVCPLEIGIERHRLLESYP